MCHQVLPFPAVDDRQDDQGSMRSEPDERQDVDVTDWLTLISKNYNIEAHFGQDKVGKEYSEDVPLRRPEYCMFLLERAREMCDCTIFGSSFITQNCKQLRDFLTGVDVRV